MERRFAAAIVSALGLHAALGGVGAWCIITAPEAPVPASGPEIEVALLVQDRGSAPRTPSREAAASAANSGPSTPGAARFDAVRTPQQAALTAPGATEVIAGVQPAAAESSTVEAGGPGAAERSPAAAARRPIDLGLDGAIVARELRGTYERPAARRPGPTFDGWSEGILRGIAQNSAPREGSALLIVEWDAGGRLASVRSSAESADANGWRKLAESLKGKLAQRPQPSAGRLRLVYLVKSEVVKPGSRSKLPQSDNVSAELLRDEYLPPGGALMLGVKADTSPAAHRVVSVTLASSQVL